MAFNSTTFDLENSTLKTLNAIRLSSLPVSNLYAIFALVWLVLDSTLMTVTDLIL